MDQGRVNLDASLALLDGLAGAGLERLVFSPGSRNTPLVLAAQLHPQIRESVAVDERSAAWQALGMARVSGRPVALVCTSGTAVANWHPAVVEADRQGLPLVLISADRPWELQHCGANQTIDQGNLFAAHVRAFHPLAAPEQGWDQRRRLQALGRQLVRETLNADPGPVHLNFPFREPLVPETLPEAVNAVTISSLGRPMPSLPVGELKALAEKLVAGKGIIVCGPGEVPPLVLTLGAQCRVPVLADPLSGLRFQSEGPAPLACYDLFLRNPRLRETLRPDWILHFGAPPVSKALLAWLAAQPQADYWWVSPAGRWLDLPGRSVETLVTSPAFLAADLLTRLPSAADTSWLASWRDLEQKAMELVTSVALPPEADMLRLLLNKLPSGSLLFVANSLPVRFLDACSGVAEKDIALFGNRGASGIDGNLSTLAGLAAAWPGTGKVVGVLGDLAFFHDLNALALCRERDILLLLFNNGGGAIFDYLPQRRLPGHEQGWRTPVPLDHEKLAAAFDICYRRVRQPGEFAGALDELLSRSGPRLLEIVIDAEASRQQYLDLTQRFMES